MSEHKNLAEALAAFQAELPTIKKTHKAKVKTRTGSDFEYAYAGLPEVSAAVLPLLGKNGLSFVASPTLSSDRFVLAYRLLHASGESLSGEYPLPSNGSAQELGSAITYARRYALCSVVGVAAEDDDDGQGAARTDVRERGRRREAEPEWDATEQQMLVDGWSTDIDNAQTAEAIAEIGKAISSARRNGGLSPASYDHLARRGAARKAELNGAAS